MAITFFSDAFFASPYAMAVFVTLEEKKLPYTLKTVALHERQQRQPDYRARSITGRVPALDHDNFRLAESAAIVEYLDETFPAPEYPRVLPSDRHDRARARMVMQWIRSDLMAIREERSTASLFCGQPVKPLSDAARGAAERLLEAATQLVPDGATSLFGEWSAADTDLALMLQRLLLHGYEAPAKIHAYVAAVWGRPSVQKWIKLERPPYVAY